MKPEVTYPDVERLVVDYLEAALEDVGEDVTCSIGVPTDWTPDSTTHLQVVSDGVPSYDHPVVAHATVRLVARATTTGEAKRIATLALGLLAAHPGGDGIATTRPYTGPLPARDPATRAELASVTLRVSVRSTPIPAAS